MFREKLKKLMADKGLKQKDVARLTGKAVSTVCMWLSGKSSPPDCELESLAEALGVAPDYFTASLDEMPKCISTTEAAKLLGMSRRVLEAGIRQGVFPWARAIRATKKYTYKINARKFCEMEGVKL